MRRAALAQDALPGHPVDLGHDGLEARGRGLFVAGRNGLEHPADRVADLRAQRHVVRAALDRLPSALLSRLDIRDVNVRCWRVGARGGPVLFGAPVGESSKAARSLCRFDWASRLEHPSRDTPEGHPCGSVAHIPVRSRSWEDIRDVTPNRTDVPRPDLLDSPTDSQDPALLDSPTTRVAPPCSSRRRAGPSGCSSRRPSWRRSRFLSRVTGLARDISFSMWFGAGPVMDAFAVAFKIPNLLRRFFGEGAFSQAFVPVISEYRATRSPADTRGLIDRTTGTLALVLFGITLLGVIAAPLVILVFAPGFLDDAGRFPLTVRMLRLTFPYIFFVSLTALAGSILNAHRRFAVPAFTPVLLNVVMIACAGWVEPRLPWPGLGLASGVFVAGIVQLAFQLPFLKRLGLLPRPRWDLAHEGVRRIFRLMLPAMFGSSVAQVSILVDTLIASFLVAGSISWLFYSERLTSSRSACSASRSAR